MAKSSTTAAQLEAMRESLLPLTLVREHCKVDDVPTVTDTMLTLYREAAFATAALYTDLDLDPDDYTIEEVPFPSGMTTTHRMKYGAVDGVVTVTINGYSYNQAITPGGKSIVVGPGVPGPNGEVVCCGTTCGPTPALNYYRGSQPITLRYKSSNCGEITIPAGIKVAMLQMIAWLIEHPGSGCEGERLAIASAAMESLRPYRTAIGF